MSDVPTLDPMDLGVDVRLPVVPGSSRPTSLRRAWPRRLGAAEQVSLVLELDAAGGITGAEVPAAGVELVRHDPALPGLAGWRDDAGAQVVGHRPGRRAVLRATDGRFVKLARPRSAGEAKRRLDALETFLSSPSSPEGETPNGALPGRPQVLSVDPDRGETVLAPAGGVALSSVLACRDEAAAARAGDRLGASFSAMARLDPGSANGLPDHTLADEVTVLRRWAAAATGAGVVRGEGARELRGWVEDVAAAIARMPAATPVVAHRDLHEGQVLVTADAAATNIVVLDWDTAALADPAADLANLLAHVDLLVSRDPAALPAARAFERALFAAAERDGHPVLRLPDGDRRLGVLRRATALRLVCVHAFRRLVTLPSSPP